MNIRLLLPNITTDRIVMLSVTIIVCIMILYPLGTLIFYSFTISEWGKPLIYTLNNFKKVLTTLRYLEAIKNSLIISFFTSIFAGALGITLAWITARTNTPLRGKLEPLNMVPYFLSPFVGAISWTYILSPKIGFINIYLMDIFNLEQPPFNIYSIPGIIWILGLFWAPYAYLFMVGLFEKMDPSLEDAAKISGASMFRTLITVTFPLALPGILFSLSIIFIISLGTFSVPAILGLPFGINVLGTEIWSITSAYPGDYNLASALSMITLLICIFIVFVQRKIILPREFITVTGKGYRPSLIDLGKWKYLTLTFNLLFLLLAVMLPIFILLTVSLHKVWRGSFHLNNLTLSSFSFILTKYSTAKNAIWNSLSLGFFGATIAIFLCIVLVFILLRTRVKGRGFLEFIISLPIGIPGIVLAMGILLAYIRTPLYGTLSVMAIAYITHFLPIGLRNTNAIFLSISPELEESSRTCGASWFKTLKNISVPLMKSGLIGGWLILFLIFTKEINSSILLFSSGNEVISIVLFQLIDEYSTPVVAAYGVILTGILLGVVWAVRQVIGLEKIK